MLVDHPPIFRNTPARCMKALCHSFGITRIVEQYPLLMNVAAYQCGKEPGATVIPLLTTRLSRQFDVTGPRVLYMERIPSFLRVVTAAAAFLYESFIIRRTTQSASPDSCRR